MFVALGLTAQKKDMKKVNVDALASETQKSIDGEDRMGFVWWIPYEFWEAIMAQEEGGEAGAEVFVSMKKYNVVMVVDGHSKNGLTYSYLNESDIRKNIKIKNTSGKYVEPLEENEIDFETKFVLDLMKPILKNLIGDLGENCQFMVFSNLENEKVIVDSYSDEDFNVLYQDENYIYDLPLAALLNDKKCPTDNATWNPKYKFCPMHGVELK